ncbi:hypothetical protein B0H16DRAFT_1469592 [Mycena metata]|uniref:Uncharacterized protein n=1 Tax=Mycena metata TaxID=1033252 RepID=A0AAD7MSU6_9AGAR|nr:hypothetical protein B0H16DRAFT_1469592 [Mycena metata]
MSAVPAGTSLVLAGTGLLPPHYRLQLLLERVSAADISQVGPFSLPSVPIASPVRQYSYGRGGNGGIDHVNWATRGKGGGTAELEEIACGIEARACGIALRPSEWCGQLENGGWRWVRNRTLTAKMLRTEMGAEREVERVHFGVGNQLQEFIQSSSTGPARALSFTTPTIKLQGITKRNLCALGLVQKEYILVTNGQPSGIALGVADERWLICDQHSHPAISALCRFADGAHSKKSPGPSSAVRRQQRRQSNNPGIFVVLRLPRARSGRHGPGTNRQLRDAMRRRRLSGNPSPLPSPHPEPAQPPSRIPRAPAPIRRVNARYSGGGGPARSSEARRRPARGYTRRLFRAAFTARAMCGFPRVVYGFVRSPTIRPLLQRAAWPVKRRSAPRYSEGRIGSISARSPVVRAATPSVLCSVGTPSFRTIPIVRRCATDTGPTGVGLYTVPVAPLATGRQRDGYQPFSAVEKRPAPGRRDGSQFRKFYVGIQRDGLASPVFLLNFLPIQWMLIPSDPPKNSLSSLLAVRLSFSTLTTKFNLEPLEALRRDGNGTGLPVRPPLKRRPSPAPGRRAALHGSRNGTTTALSIKTCFQFYSNVFFQFFVVVVADDVEAI